MKAAREALPPMQAVLNLAEMEVCFSQATLAVLKHITLLTYDRLSQKVSSVRQRGDTIDRQGTTKTVRAFCLLG